MAWNEPGGGKKDPWSGNSGDQGPPELDEVVRKLQEKLGGLFGGAKRSGGSSGGSGPRPMGLWIAGGVVVVLWLLSGIYIVEPAERGVVLRFGAFNDDITLPGPHWHIPYPIESVEKVNVDLIESIRHKALMLTRDENIVDIELTVQYKVEDAAQYLFEVRAPAETLKDAIETSVRETIGKNNLDFILTEGRSAVAVAIQERIQALISQYKAGLLVTSVNMQPAKPPDEVKSAFDDAIKAREDKERLENEAEAYANEVVPKARGAAARIVEESKAYRDQVVARAEGDAQRFTQLLTEYRKAPQVTRDRLYLETMEGVLSNTNKVLVDTKSGNSLMYLPLDKLMESSRGTPTDPMMSRRAAVPQSATGGQPTAETDTGRRAR